MEQTAVAAAALVRAEILGPTAPATFVHPLVRDAIYHEIPFADRPVGGDPRIVARGDRLDYQMRTRSAGAR